MLRRFSINYALFAIGLDAILVCSSLYLATLMRPALDFLPFAAEYPEFIPTPLAVYFIFAIEWIAIGGLLSLYDGRKNLREVDEFFHLSITSLVATVSMAGTLFISFRLVSRLLFISFAVMMYLSMSAWRIIARLARQRITNDSLHQRRLLIIGLNSIGIQLQEQIEKYPQLGIRVVGYADDEPEVTNEPPGLIISTKEIENTILNEKVDDIIIALPQKAYRRINELIVQLHTLPVKVWVIPDYFRLALHKATIEEIAGIPLLDLRAPALRDIQRLVKRGFDLGVTIISLPLVIPLMSIAALAVRLDSPGKIIFRQKRVGENGKLFWMYKFRTMLENAEDIRSSVERIDEEGNILHKSIHDPRVTRVGRRLRKWSVDELPQLLNVLKGEMSLVGPRPELPYMVERYALWQRKRFAVPQGITGWWQIQGRSDRPMHLNTEDDIYYVQNYSILLDIYILVKTIGAVIRGKGAY